MTSGGKRRLRGFIGAACLAAATLGPARECRADDIAPDGKGVAGGILLGAEAVVITEALVGVEPWWAYALGGGLGAVGGGVGGYFAEQTGSGELAVGLLVGGMVMVIPGALAVTSGTRYNPPEGDQGAPDGANLQPVPTLATLPPALLAVREGDISLAVPAVRVSETHTRLEVALFGARQAAQVSVPVLNVWF